MEQKIESKHEEIKYYPGNILQCPGRYRVTLRDQYKVVYTASFNFTNRSENDTKKAAELKLMEECDHHGLTIIQKVKILSREKQQYLAGAFDGDGSIMFTSEGKLVIGFYQSSSNDKPPPLIVEFQEAFGGNISGPQVRKKRPDRKPEYRFFLFGKQCKPLLKLVLDWGIIKAPQASLGLECIAKESGRKSSPNLTLTKPDQKHFFQVFSKAKKEYKSVAIDKVKVTDAWIAGFFDSEGCVAHGSINDISSHQIYLNFTQVGCPNILRVINEKLGNFGTIESKGQLRFRAQEHVSMVISRIEAFVIEKKAQIALIKEHLATVTGRKRRKRTDEDKCYDIDMAVKVRALKHFQGGLKSGEIYIVQEETIEEETYAEKSLSHVICEKKMNAV